MAFGIDDAIAAGAKLVDDAINKIWPNPEDKAKAEAISITAATTAAIETIKVNMAIPLAEAQSSDKWTSRARPSFLYTMYTMILWSIPFSLIYAGNPEFATQMIEGAGKWLAAVPEILWTVFKDCFIAYTMARTTQIVAPHVADAIKGKR